MKLVAFFKKKKRQIKFELNNLEVNGKLEVKRESVGK